MRSPPAESSVMLTAGWPSCEYVNPASMISSPEATTARLSVCDCSVPLPGYDREPGTSPVWSTIRNSRVAVAVSIFSSSVGSCTPGSCTTMRSTPCRCTSGSATPSWSTRLRKVVMFCSIAKSCRSLICSSVMRTRSDVPSVPSAIARFASARVTIPLATSRSSALRSRIVIIPLFKSTRRLMRSSTNPSKIACW